MHLPCVLAVCTFLAEAALLAQSAPAQEYPNRTVKQIVPLPPGAATGGNARLLLPSIRLEPE